jgi:ABC-2 type transport system permease protein
MSGSVVSSVGVVLAILRRECAAYFRTPAGWVVLALFLALQGVVFWTFLQVLGRPDAPPGGVMELFFGGTILYWIALGLLATVLPIRLIAEERRAGTLEPLLTAPVSPGEVVLGKWLAALAFYVAAWAPTLLYVAYLHRIGGSPDPGPTAAGYLGTLLLGAAFLALGLLASSLTRSQVIAGALSFGLFFASLLLGALEATAPSPVVAAALHRLSPFRMMEDFGRGIVDPRPMVLLASVTGLALLAAAAALGRLRGPAPLDLPRGRRLAPWISGVLVVVIGFLLNVVAARHAVRGDWTRRGRYALSDQMTTLLRGLPRPVAVTVFIYPRRDDERARLVAGLLRELCERCARSSGGRFSFEVVDPDRAPERAEAAARRYGVGAYDMGQTVVVFTSGARSKVVTEDALVDPELDAAGAPQPGVRAWRGEVAFADALTAVAEARAPRICFTTGHGEPGLDSTEEAGYATFADRLRAEGDEPRSVGSVAAATLSGCRALVIAEPRRAWAPAEIAALTAFVEGGGGLLAMLGPLFTAAGDRFAPLGLEGFAARYGVRLGENLVVDPAHASDVEGPSVWTAGPESYRPHAIADALRSQPTIWPRTREVAPAGERPLGVWVSPLVQSSAAGWGETDLRTIRGDADLSFDRDHDRKGPVPVAVAVERAANGQRPAARLVFLGTGRLVMNYRLAGLTPRDHDAELVRAALAWLVDSGPRIEIAPKIAEPVALPLSAADLNWAFRLFVVLLPLGTLVAGALTWWRRRI